MTQAPADLLADLNANAAGLPAAPPTPKVQVTPEIEAWLSSLSEDEAAKARAAMGLPEPAPETEPAPEPVVAPEPAKEEPAPSRGRGRPRAKAITAEHADRLIAVLERIADAIERKDV